MKQEKRLSEIIMEEAEKFDGKAQISHHIPKMELILSSHNNSGGVNNLHTARVVNDRMETIIIFRSWKSMEHCKKRAEKYMYKIRMTPIRLNSNIPH